MASSELPSGLEPEQPLVARVLPDVGGFHRQLDYLVPEAMGAHVRPGTIVRVPLQGRRVRGWVTACPVLPPEGVTLRPVTKVTGWGPEPELLELAQWAAWRWWGRPRSFLATASPLSAVVTLPLGPGGHVLGGRKPGYGPPNFGPLTTAWAVRVGPAPGTPGPEAELVNEAWTAGAAVVRLPPNYRATEVVLAALSAAPQPGAGPLLVVAPTTARAEAGYSALRRRGMNVALLPGDWAQARAGTAQVVIGARAAAWGPCPGVAGVIVLDAHDEGLVQGQAPTWDAPTVAVERARRAGVPCLLVSSCPTLELSALAGENVNVVSRAAERKGWAPLRAVDTRAEDPRSGLYSRAIVELVQGQSRVACVLNRKGRAQLLACAACRSTATCEQCGSAVQLMDEILTCRRCGSSRPVVCRYCGSDVLRQLRVGVARAREQLEALAGRPVGEVTESTKELPSCSVLVGTEALLYREGELRRAGGIDVVAFLDFDQELLVPRYRAAEQALALLARASRIVGDRRGGLIVVQTRVPHHPVVDAVLRADPDVVSEAERPVRQALHLPPFGALALLSGPGADEVASQLQVLVDDGRVALAVNELNERNWMVKAPDNAALAAALAQVERPGERVRVEVGPVRV